MCLTQIERELLYEVRSKFFYQRVKKKSEYHRIIKAKTKKLNSRVKYLHIETYVNEFVYFNIDKNFYFFKNKERCLNHEKLLLGDLNKILSKSYNSSLSKSHKAMFKLIQIGLYRYIDINKNINEFKDVTIFSIIAAAKEIILDENLKNVTKQDMVIYKKYFNLFLPNYPPTFLIDQLNKLKVYPKDKLAYSVDFYIERLGIILFRTIIFNLIIDMLYDFTNDFYKFYTLVNFVDNNLLLYYYLDLYDFVFSELDFLKREDGYSNKK